MVLYLLFSRRSKLGISSGLTQRSCFFDRLLPPMVMRLVRRRDVLVRRWVQKPGVRTLRRRAPSEAGAWLASTSSVTPALAVFSLASPSSVISFSVLGSRGRRVIFSVTTMSAGMKSIACHCDEYCSAPTLSGSPGLRKGVEHVEEHLSTAALPDRESKVIFAFTYQGPRYGHERLRADLDQRRSRVVGRYPSPDGLT